MIRSKPHAGCPLKVLHQRQDVDRLTARLKERPASRRAGRLSPDDGEGARSGRNEGLMPVCPFDPVAHAHFAVDDSQNFSLPRG